MPVSILMARMIGLFCIRCVIGNDSRAWMHQVLERECHWLEQIDFNSACAVGFGRRSHVPSTEALPYQPCENSGACRLIRIKGRAGLTVS
jgi:hypothetical protein